MDGDVNVRRAGFGPFMDVKKLDKNTQYGYCEGV